MPDSKQYFRPEILSRISRLELRAKYVVQGCFAGMHRGNSFGHSTEFRQHREYVPGDDPRFIDWKVWAREDRLYVKQQQIETRRNCLVLLDRSGSMAYRGAIWSKYDCGATLAVTMAWLSVLRHDAAGCLLFDSKPGPSTSFETDHAQPIAIANLLEQYLPTVSNNVADRSSSNASDDTNVQLADTLRYAAGLVPKGSLIVIISDLFVHRKSFFDALQILGNAGHQTAVFQILDDDEIDFPFRDPIRFRDCESQRSTSCSADEVRDEYMSAIKLFLDEIRRGCLSHNVYHTLLRTGSPLDAALAEYAVTC